MNTEQIPVCATVDVGEKKGLSYKWISAFGNPGILLVSKNIFLETINSTVLRAQTCQSRSLEGKTREQTELHNFIVNINEKGGNRKMNILKRHYRGRKLIYIIC